MDTKHQLLFAEIQNRILSGEWYRGMLMPTETELCQTHRVSRITVRRALDDLERLGLINRIQGKGSFVCRGILRSGEGQKGFSQHLRDMGILVHSRLLRQERVCAPPDIRMRLRIPGDDPGMVWFFSRLRIIGERPAAVMNTYVPLDMGRRMLAFDLEWESFYYLYEKISGKKIITTDSTVTAIKPSGEICQLLRVEYDSAHILYKSVGFFEDNEPAEFSYSIFNANLYEFSVNMNNVRLMQPL
ncbi:MAG: GntR family transcriptional regulator [Treponema sp.]|jgi:GntR family transcriptional regulator|nr:GntR family transcriptional regulator [Treponema sp.]